MPPDLPLPDRVDDPADRPVDRPIDRPIDIAVGIVCRNEADDLDACLATVPWAREIYVLNMGSTDHTLAVAARYGAEVIDVPDVPVAERVRNRYLERYRATWLLQLDCDERIPAGWLEAVLPILAEDEPSDVAAYVLPFRHFALNVPLDHGMGRNGSVRLFRHGRVRYDEGQAAHRNPILEGSLLEMTGRVPPVDHYSIRSIDSYMEKAIRYAKTESADLTRDDLDAFVTFREFYRWTLVEGGWRDGFPGVAMATAYAFSRGLAHLYAWERLSGDPVPLRGMTSVIASESDYRKELVRVRSEAVLSPIHGHSRSWSTGAFVNGWRSALGKDPTLSIRPAGVKAALVTTGERVRGAVTRRGTT